MAAGEPAGAEQRGGFNPFGRGDPRALAITEDDERLLSRDPAPLRVTVPVTIEDVEQGDGARSVPEV